MRLVLGLLACLLYHNSYQGARGSHRHTTSRHLLDECRQDLWNSRGREGGRDPPRSAGIALTVNPVFTGELVMSDLRKSV